MGLSVTAEESPRWGVFCWSFVLDFRAAVESSRLDRVNMAAAEKALPESCILSFMASLLQNIFAVDIFSVMARFISIVHTSRPRPATVVTGHLSGRRESIRRR